MIVEARKELEAKLSEIKQDIPAFNELTPPDVAKDLHQQIVGYNEKLNTLIDTAMTKIEEGKVNVEEFKKLGAYADGRSSSRFEREGAKFRSIVKGSVYHKRSLLLLDTINDYTNDNNHVADEFTFRYFFS